MTGCVGFARESFFSRCTTSRGSDTTTICSAADDLAEVVDLSADSACLSHVSKIAVVITLLLPVTVGQNHINSIDDCLTCPQSML